MANLQNHRTSSCTKFITKDTKPPRGDWQEGQGHRPPTPRPWLAGENLPNTEKSQNTEKQPPPPRASTEVLPPGKLSVKREGTMMTLTEFLEGNFLASLLRMATAGTPQPVPHGQHPTAGTPQRAPHGRHPTAGTPRPAPHSRYPTAILCCDLLQKPGN